MISTLKRTGIGSASGIEAASEPRLSTVPKTDGSEDGGGAICNRISASGEAGTLGHQSP
ncbi:hypothetical protein [uncultured Methylobacterium sp.]|uniref:hypothetical protein n=1 Tax=uncultured Methylobacterium sp. TaxID=157278 RepID=UPI0035CC80C8